MTYAYRQTLTAGPMGHYATAMARDAVESLVAGAVEDGETLTVAVEGEGRMTVTLESPRLMKAHELDALAEAVRSAALDCLVDGDEAILSGFEIVEVPRPPGMR